MTPPNASFLEQARRYIGNAFPYHCTCGAFVPIRSRITQKRRKCPQCGSEITVERIDKMVAEASKDERYAKEFDKPINWRGAYLRFRI